MKISGALVFAVFLTGCLVNESLAQTQTPIADDRFVVMLVDDLRWDLTDVDPTIAAKLQARDHSEQDLLLDRIVLNNMGEAVDVPSFSQLSNEAREIEFSMVRSSSDPPLQTTFRALLDARRMIVIRTPEKGEIQGWAEFHDMQSIDWNRVNYQETAVIRVPFRIPADLSSKNGELVFWVAKRHEWKQLAESGTVGSEWWELQSLRLDYHLGFQSVRPPLGGSIGIVQRRSSFDLLSGGQSVRENIQLERLLARRPAGAQIVKPKALKIDRDLQTLVGITSPEFNWKPLLTEPVIPAEPLAHFIPHDQHAVFFSSPDDFQRFINELSDFGLPLLHTSQAMGEISDWPQKYFSQMQIPFSRIDTWTGIKALAITGGDPYFDHGTDVAVLFLGDIEEATKDMEKRTEVNVPAEKNITVGIVEYREHSIRFLRNPDRSICCYWTTFADVLAVANSQESLQRIIDAKHGQSPALASLEEYQFFRQRYPHDSVTETAFLLISDATIRRWCSPKWRIGQHRRVQALRVLRKAQMLQKTPGFSAKDDRLILQQHLGVVPYLNSLEILSGQVYSETYGHSSFLTPIVELEFNMGTVSEVQGYESWRQEYETGWSTAFDPIGLSLHMTEEGLTGDLTVMPLIGWTDYRWIQQFVGPVDLNQSPSLNADLHVEVQTARDAEYDGGLRDFLAGLVGQEKSQLEWLGNIWSIWIVEPSERSSEDDDLEFWLSWLRELAPVVIALEVVDEPQAVAYVELLGKIMAETKRKFEWNDVEFGGERVLTANIFGFQFYIASGSPLLVSIDAVSLQEALKIRRLAKDTPKSANTVRFNDDLGLGKHVRARVTHKGYEMLLDLPANRLLGGGISAGEEISTAEMAKRNLAILNEWYRLHPGRDPVEVHRELFGVGLQAPDGTGYRWNEEDRTMESLSYGHPTRSKVGPRLPPALGRIELSQFGLTFEHDGIRARTQLDWRPNR